MNTQPEALRLINNRQNAHMLSWQANACAELRRLHEVNAELLTRLEEARDLVNDWGECASLEERERYGLSIDLQMLDATIAKHGEQK